LDFLLAHFGVIWRQKMLDKSSGKSKAEKREKFVELAQSRTINAIKAIRVIAKLGNKSAYDYTEADVKKIASALQREIDALKARMTQSGTKNSVDFSL
jgi:ribosomal protein L7/L12